MCFSSGGIGTGLASTGGGGGEVSSGVWRARENIGARVLRNDPIPAPHDARLCLEGLVIESEGEPGGWGCVVGGGVSRVELLDNRENGRILLGDGAGAGD